MCDENEYDFDVDDRYYNERPCESCGLVHAGDGCPIDWQCAFPGECLMVGDHHRSECHTIEMLEQQEFKPSVVTLLRSFADEQGITEGALVRITVFEGQPDETSVCGRVVLVDHQDELKSC